MDETVERERRAIARAPAGAAIGVLTGAFAIATSHLVAGLGEPSASPVVAVGQAAIDAAPAWLKDWAIRTFGEADKTVLLTGIATVLALIAVVAGIVSVRRPALALATLGTLAVIGVVAALTRPGATPFDAVPTMAGAAAGALAFVWLRRRSTVGDVSSGGASVGASVGASGPGALERRRFLLGGAAVAVGALAAGGLGQVLGRRLRADASRAAVAIPLPAAPAGSSRGSDLHVPGVEPFFTPNDRFYRVDTALIVPSVAAEEWRLRIHGMVDRELVLDHEELLARPLIERDITLACVSNEVGGTYVGNARWIGAPLRDLLEEAGVDPGADQIVSRSADGFTAGTPTAVAMDGRDAMLAVAMNGEPLPLEHGFPVRMIVPGLYGYVSATKWLVDLELTTFDAFDPYWVRRGWAPEAPIKTMSRIDTPNATRELRAGDVVVAGVAWAQHRGIERVEVRVDDGAWFDADLAPASSIDTWRQWAATWSASPGAHRLQVRATDADGETQPEARVTPFPDGATGWHTLAVVVR